jgi:hypothetical protein
MEPKDEGGLILVSLVILAGLVYAIYRIMRGSGK